MTEAPPPAYHEVVGKVVNQLQNTGSIDAWSSILNGLHPNDVKILTSHEAPKPQMTPEEEAKYQEGFKKAFDSDTAKRHMELQADEISKACQAIETSFDTLGAKLAKIDALAGAEKEIKFSSAFADHRKKYREILDLSRAHAVEIAGYGERFDDVIVPYFLDKELSKERKLAKIEEFIGDSKKFEQYAKDTTDGFAALKVKLEEFTGTFSTWSVKREGELADEVKELTKGIDALQTEIEDLQKKLLISGGVAAGSLPVFGIIAACSGPFAPFAIISGVISAGVAAGFAISYAAKITDRKAQKQAKEDRRKDLNKTISDIKKTRTELEELGKQNLATYGANIALLNQVWTYVKADAVAIQGYLKETEKDIGDPPKYVMISTGKAGGMYAQMSVYLRRYADGVKPKA